MLPKIVMISIPTEMERKYFKQEHYNNSNGKDGDDDADVDDNSDVEDKYNKQKQCR